MSFLVLGVGGLATWRVSHMIVKETGPLMVFSRLRAFLARKQKHMGGLFDALSCTSCTSIWIGALAALGVAHGVLEWFGYSLAFSALSMLLESFFSKNTDTFPLVAPPAANDKVLVGRSSTPK